MTIDLTIPGDTGAIRDVATWLRDVGGAVEGNTSELFLNQSDSSAYWQGEAGDAYRNALLAIQNAAHPVPSYADDAAEVFDAYAARLERGRETFASYREQALNRGLIIVGLTIYPPRTALDYCPGDDSPAEDVAEWDRYTRDLADYDTVAQAVGEWWGELELWVAEHFAPLVERVAELSPIGAVFDALHENESTVIDAALSAAEERADRDLTDWRAAAEQAQSDFDLFVDDLNSGHPGVRAAAEAVDFGGLRQEIRALNEAVQGVSRYSRVLPVVGGIVDAASATIELIDGGSPVSVAISVLGGAAGGAGGAAIFAGGPAAWIVAGGVIGAVVVGEGGRWLWEAAVPLEHREAIDAGLQGEDILFTEEVVGLAPDPLPPGPALPGQEGWA